LCDWWLETGSDRERRILEVGAGTGRFARSFLDRLRERRPETYSTLQYLIVDLSPALRVSQDRLCSEHARILRSVSGDALTVTLPEKSVDFIVCNEMIADLPVAQVSRRRIGESRAASPAEELVQRFGLEFPEGYSLLDQTLVNEGAIQLLERMRRWLRPGGRALIVEYGQRRQAPVAVTLGGHTEFSIDFGHLFQVAERLRLEPALESLGTFLGFDAGCRVLGMPSSKLLGRYLLPRLGRKPAAVLMYAEEDVGALLGSDFQRVGNLRFHPLASKETGLSPFSFQVLKLRASDD
jgi:SAM-dependent methyltransferase